MALGQREPSRGQLAVVDERLDGPSVHEQLDVLHGLARFSFGRSAGNALVLENNLLTSDIELKSSPNRDPHLASNAESVPLSGNLGGVTGSQLQRVPFVRTGMQMADLRDGFAE